MSLVKQITPISLLSIKDLREVAASKAINWQTVEASIAKKIANRLQISGW